MDIIGKKWWYIAISVAVMIPGIIVLMVYGLKLGIDYTGGTLLELRFPERSADSNQAEQLKQSLDGNQVAVASVAQTDRNQYLFRLKPIDNTQKETIKTSLAKNFGKVEEVQYETVGPTVSGNLSWKTFFAPILYPFKSFGAYVPDDNITKAFISVFWASMGILIYIAYSFRKMPKPASSWRFGIAAIIALLHDVVIVIGAFAIFGWLWHVEVDALFITALLTVMGFSVHDTIVIFDRIRENIEKNRNLSFSQVTNISIVQTLGRSLATSLTVLFVLLALLLFGGESIRWFVAALLVGIISGTYSSIFNAAPILVVWDEWSKKRQGKALLPSFNKAAATR